METIGSVDLYSQCSLVKENRCFANQLSYRVHTHKEQKYVDPISFDRNSIAEEWVAEMEMHQEDTENPDWMSLDPPSENSRLLELSVDEVEELGSGN